MDVISISPFRTGSVLWRPRPDRWTLTVVCKATYGLEPGECPLAADQEPVRDRDTFWEDDARRSVHAPGDLAPFKPRADVTLVGHAYAPRSEMVRALVARLHVGEMEKAVEVLCPRVVGREGDLREGARWNKAPLRYEYAAGGLDTWNPVGIGPGAPADPYGQRPLPHLQPAGLRVTQWRDAFVPIGFGPIAASWRLRRDRLGRRAEGWSDEGWPRVALDDEFDGEFFQVAPPDQQIDALRDDERILLEYLHPDHPSLTTKLSGVHPRAFVEIPGAPPRDLVMTADALWIDTDRALCTMTWRGQVAVEGPDQPGRVLVAIEESGQNLNWTSIAGPNPSGGTLVPDPPDAGRRGMSTLPFVSPDLSAPIHDDAADPVATPRTAPRARPSGPGGQPPAEAAERAPLTPRVEPAAANEPPPTPFHSGAGARKTLPMMLEVERHWPAPAPDPEPSPAAASVAFSPEEALTLAPPPDDTPPRATVPMAPPAPPADDPYPALPVLVRERAATQVSGPFDLPRSPPPPTAVRDRAFELIWHDPSLGARLPREAAFSHLFPAEAPASAPPKLSPAEVAAVLARATPAAAGLEQILFESASGSGALIAPLVLLAGEISFGFDEVEEVRALVAAVGPARADVSLAGLLELAEDMARTELQGSPEVAEGLCTSLRDAWAQANKVLPPGHLGQVVERALLHHRAYQRRTLLGKRWIRAVLSSPPSAPAGGAPAYLPAAVATRLPLFRHFPARLLAEVLPRQDQAETSPVALRVLALAREVSRRA